MFSKSLVRLLAMALILGATIVPVLSGCNKAEEPEPLKILILGGTGFIGPWQVEAAQKAGHEITLFNRGKTNTHLFPELEKLVGDRDPDKGEGLKALEGRQWDVVIDNSAYYPRHVKASAELLAPHVKHYIIISSISAYGRTDIEGQDEDAELATMDDPTVEEMGDQWQNYGPLKALCEQAAEAAMPGRVTVVRPGYIVGPGDHTHRFSYWPLRIRQGGPMAVPGAPTDPVQIIDVRDLTEWIIHLAEEGTTGVFNACGPAEGLTMGEMVEQTRTALASNAEFAWLGTGFNEAHPDVYFPIWTPFEGDYKGFHTFSVARAVAAGLEFRPVEDTVTALMEWFDAKPDEEKAAIMERIPVPGEAELLANQSP